MPDSHFLRLAGLPAYVLGAVDDKKNALRARGEEVYDFGLGNPDRPTPESVVARLQAAAAQTENQRYLPSPGVRPLRAAICRWWERRYGVTLDPDTEAVATIGSKEGLAHLLLAVVGPGDVVLAPDPCYPIHRMGVHFAGGHYQGVPTNPSRRDPVGDLEAAYQAAPRPAKLAIVNFPHNPTTAVVDARTMEAIVRWAEKHDLWLISDLAYADLVFEGGRTPSALAVAGARERTVEFFTTSKSFNMAGWRCGFCVGNATLVGALRKIKGYLDYGLFGGIQQATITALDGGDELAGEMRETYRARAAALVEGLRAAGWRVDPPKATMFVWAQVPEPFRAGGSIDFAVKLLDGARVAVAPGVGFGEGGEGFVRFGLVEEVPRIEAACRSIGAFLERARG
jgi:alanine-synthesizing transaminase